MSLLVLLECGYFTELKFRFNLSLAQHKTRLISVIKQKQYYQIFFCFIQLPKHAVLLTEDIFYATYDFYTAMSNLTKD